MMFVPFVALSLATSLFVGSGAALDVDVKDQDSIKNVAKTLAGGIVSKYKDDVKTDLIPGLFSKPYYWWEAGAVLGSLIDYSFLTGDSQYDDLIGEGVKHQIGEDNAFLPLNQSKSLGNDDQSFWGLAAMSAAENSFTTSKIGNLTWIDLAKNVFDTQVPRWDNETCDGGLRWMIFQFSSGYSYKNSVSNGNFFLLASRLAKFTGNSTYSEWAEKAFQWTQDVGLVDEEFRVFDGTDSNKNCSDTNEIQWASNNGIFLEAAAHMYNVTKGNDKWKKVVAGLVNSTSNVFTKDQILREVACEANGKCNTDQRANKAIAARSYARAALSAPFIADSITSILQASAKGAADGCSGEKGDLKCQLRWNGKGEAVGVDGGLGEAFSALAVVQALLVPNAKAPATGSASSSNGTSNGSPTGNSQASGSVVPAEGAAGALVASHSLVVALVVLAVAFL